MPDIPHAEVDYNIVQNNGPGAAQVVPHAHFHIVPRYPFDYVPPSTAELTRTLEEAERGVGVGERRGAELGNNAWSKADARKKAELPEGLEATRILFGRGQRHYRDEEDAEVLIRMMRERVRVEWEREFGDSGDEKTGTNPEGSSGVDGRMTREKRLPFKSGGGSFEHFLNRRARSQTAYKLGRKCIDLSYSSQNLVMAQASSYLAKRYARSHLRSIEGQECCEQPYNRSSRTYSEQIRSYTEQPPASQSTLPAVLSTSAICILAQTRIGMIWGS